MVLNSTNIIEDSQFQALSVSAEKWVPIIQVASWLCTSLLSFSSICMTGQSIKFRGIPQEH